MPLSHGGIRGTLTCIRLTVLFRVAGSLYLKDYCQWDKLNVSCPAHQVVVMETALYGRMRAGTCVRGEQLGCQRDVLSYADSRCSGRRRCAILVADVALAGYMPCPSDYTSYLQASHRCQQVAVEPVDSCTTSHSIRITGNEGYISSLDSSIIGGRTSKCPWQIVVDPGQRINLTLYDFGRHVEPGERNSLGPSFCPRYATLRERGGREHHICGGNNQRATNVYLSESNAVWVDMLRGSVGADTRPHYMFHYKAVGCGVPRLGSGLHSSRHNQGLMVVCNATGERWHLTCVDATWRGLVGNCSVDGAGSVPGQSDTGIWNVLVHDWNSSYGVIIVISLGIVLGILIGTSLLGIALCCMKRKNSICNRVCFTGRGLQEEAMELPPPPPPQDLKNPYFPGQPCDRGDYGDMWGLQRLVPPYSGTEAGTVVSSGYQTMSVESSILRTESVRSADTISSKSENNVYESPKFTRKEISGAR